MRAHVEVGLVTHYALMAAAIPGALLWRRRSTLLPLAAVAGTSILTGAITFGIARYRIGTDVVLVVLGAVAIGHVLDRYGPPAGRPPAEPLPAPAPEDVSV